MARPTKQGLDYFPFDVDFFEDDKLEFVTARFGEKGELIAIKLLCIIYRNGYYTDWNDDKALIFSKRAGKSISSSLANAVVSELVKRGFFDKDIFNSFSVLTSRGIQKRFLNALKERTAIDIIADYWLIDLPKSTKGKKFEIIYQNSGVSRTENEVSRTGKPLKESKVNESKEKSKTPSAAKAAAGDNQKKSSTKAAEETKAEIRAIRDSYVFSERLSKAVDDFVQYKNERKQSYKPMGLKTLLSRIQKNATEHGEEAVISAIDECMSNNWQGIVWEHVKQKGERGGSNWKHNGKRQNSEHSAKTTTAIYGEIIG